MQYVGPDLPQCRGRVATKGRGLLARRVGFHPLPIRPSTMGFTIGTVPERLPRFYCSRLTQGTERVLVDRRTVLCFSTYQVERAKRHSCAGIGAGYGLVHSSHYSNGKS
jgi:hypothetical protein